MKEVGYRIVGTVSRQQSRLETGKRNTADKDGVRYLKEQQNE